VHSDADLRIHLQEMRRRVRDSCPQFIHETRVPELQKPAAWPAPLDLRRAGHAKPRVRLKLRRLLERQLRHV
jgi:hypothetical protein